MERRPWNRLVEVIRQEFDALPERIRRENEIAREIGDRLLRAEEEIEILSRRQAEHQKKLKEVGREAKEALTCLTAFLESD